MRVSQPEPSRCSRPPASHRTSGTWARSTTTKCTRLASTRRRALRGAAHGRIVGSVAFPTASGFAGRRVRRGQRQGPREPARAGVQRLHARRVVRCRSWDPRADDPLPAVGCRAGCRGDSPLRCAWRSDAELPREPSPAGLPVASQPVLGPGVWRAADETADRAVAAPWRERAQLRGEPRVKLHAADHRRVR